MAPIKRSHVNIAKPMIAKNSKGEGTLGSSISSLTVRAVGSKDRHSKVRTAKGLRDRRVRLSAPTAVQFFEVQDRLGFDQPSKALDWLIRNARTAIDELAPLEPFAVNDEADSRAVEKHDTAVVNVEQQKSCDLRGGSRAAARRRKQEGTKEKTKRNKVSPALSAPSTSSSSFITGCEAKHLGTQQLPSATAPSTSSSSFITGCEAKQLGTQQLPSANYHTIQQPSHIALPMQLKIPESLHLPTYSNYTASEPSHPLILHDFPQQLAYFSIPAAEHQTSTSYCTMPISPGGTLQSIFNDVFTDSSNSHVQSVPIVELYPLMGLHDSAVAVHPALASPQVHKLAQQPHEPGFSIPFLF